MQENSAEVSRRINQRLQEINTIYTVGKSVASSLNVSEILERVVEASVNLTQADEGFILLKQDRELYLRMSKRIKASVAQDSYKVVTDKIAWQVIHSERPTMLHRETRVATGDVAQALLYVPLQTGSHKTAGVLGMVNTEKSQSFTENHLFTLSSLADFAAIALENARLFETVEAERSRLSAILEHATEAILVTDTHNCLLLWSGTAAEAFDIQPSAQGKAIEACIQNEAICELFSRAAEGEMMPHAEVYLENERVYNTQLSHIENVGRVAIMQDITHLKELDRLKSEFVSTVSHDLRTPLTTVQGYIDLLSRVGPLTDMQVNFINKALSSLSHITALITDLLDIGRIEAGYDLEMHPIRLDEIIRNTVEAYALLAEENELKVKMALSDTPLWLQGNARRMRQVLENLLSNAIKYNRPGGWIKITAQPGEQHIIVQVEDSGIGVPLEEQPKIFERFYRVESTETKDIRGTGLGLSIVKSVIEKHKGRIWVESLPGKGSSFTFVVPTCEEPDEAYELPT